MAIDPKKVQWKPLTKPPAQNPVERKPLIRPRINPPATIEWKPLRPPRINPTALGVPFKPLEAPTKTPVVKWVKPKPRTPPRK